MSRVAEDQLTRAIDFDSIPRRSLMERDRLTTVRNGYYGKKGVSLSRPAVSAQCRKGERYGAISLARLSRAALTIAGERENSVMEWISVRLAASAAFGPAFAAASLSHS